jgi:UrcA family protein
MYTQSASVRTLLAIIIAGSLVAGIAQAKEHTVVISNTVSTSGLDLGDPADAQTLYTRLRRAANDVCTRSTRVDVPPTDNLPRCFEEALGNAVRLANSPRVTQAYLANHTLHDAATWGIDLPAELAKR